MAGPFDFTGQNIEDSYQRVLQTDGTLVYDGTGSLFTITSSPAGPSQSIQFNDDGATSGSGNFTFDKITNTVNLTGSILMSGSAAITGVDYIDFDTTASIATSTGRLYWNDVDGTLELGLKGGVVSSELGQGLVTRIVNKTTPNIYLSGSSYQVVVVSGAQGQRLAVKLAQADNDANSAGTLGLVAENIDKNQEGFIVTVGLLKNRDTTGALQGETWNDGDVLYLSPATAGAITNIKPQAPQHTVIIGYVEYAHQNNGKIYVKIDNGYELDELHNVKITTASLSSGDLLVYSSSVWVNTKQLTGSYGLTGSLQATSFTGSLLGTSSWADNALTASFINTASTNAFVQGGNSFGAQALLGTNDNQSLAFETNNATRMFISSSGNVGIGTVTPGYGLEVGNTGIYYNPGQLLITTSGSVNKEGSFIASSTGRTLQLGISDNSVVPVGIDMFETNNTFGSTYLNFRVNNADLVRMTGSLVGIGTTTPLFTLDVSGSGRFTNNLTVTGSTTLHNGQTTMQGAGATSATTALVVRNSNASSALTITDARSSSFSGNVDIAGDLSATNSSGTRKFQAGYFYDIHPEALNPGIIPFYSNDLAYNTLRGGSVSASFGPGSTYTLNTSQIEAMFDGSSNYCIMDPMATSGSVTLTVTFPQSYLYGNIIGFSFGNSSWVARDFTVELLVTGSYVTLDTQTGYTAANYTKYFGYGVNATTGARITFSNFVSPTNAAGFRIAELFLLNYNSQLGKAVFMGRDGGAVYKPITIQSGSTSAPAYSSLTDTNTGIYFPAADTLGFVEGGAEAMRINSSGQVGIGTTSPSFLLDVSGSGRFTNGLTVTGSTTLHNGQTTIQGAGATSATTALVVRNSTPTNIITVLNNGVVGINRTPTASLDVAGTTRISGSFNTAVSGSILTVIGSGSTQPIFTVQGSQGELFSITDSLTGSLFSVNDISGLPILEVFSDGTTLIGDYQDPALITTIRKTANTGVTTIYSLPTASYDGAWFDYTIRSGSDARVGTIMGMWSGSSVNYTETSASQFGTTSGFIFGMSISGSNMILSGSATTSGWTVKTIIRSI